MEVFREFAVFLALSRGAIILNAIYVFHSPFIPFFQILFHGSQGHVNLKVVV